MLLVISDQYGRIPRIVYCLLDPVVSLQAFAQTEIFSLLQYLQDYRSMLSTPERVLRLQKAVTQIEELSDSCPKIRLQVAQFNLDG